jgi:hypothetical protein
MARGLVRKNNLSDLDNPTQARVNLGLQVPDYKRIRGLVLSSGVNNLDVQKIANSSSNFQNQIGSSTSSLATITSNLYANKAGDTLTGTWTNAGKISANTVVSASVVLSGSTDVLFSRSSPLSSLQIETASGVVMPSGLSINNLVSSGNVLLVSGQTVTRTMAIAINGVPYRIDLV